MSKRFHATFTLGEINYLLSLCESNKEEGVYWGNKEEHWKRQARVVSELKSSITGKNSLFLPVDPVVDKAIDEYFAKREVKPTKLLKRK